VRRAEIARCHRRRADVGDAVERRAEVGGDARAGQHVGGAARARDRLRALQHVGKARRDQDQVREAHHLHRPRRRADVACVAGADEDEAGGVAGHAAAKMRVAHFAARPHAPGPSRRGLCRKPSLPMSQALHPMLNTAVKAARTAGAIINRASLDLERLQVNSKAPNDFVTEVDHAAEAAIIDTLLSAYPGHGILAEESGTARGARDSEYVWIIDPLDGTTNFIHGLPTYAV